jgi:hypothetical protein
MQEDAYTEIAAAAAGELPADIEPAVEAAADSETAAPEPTEAAEEAATEAVAGEAQAEAEEETARFPDLASWLPGENIWLFAVPIIIILLLWILYPVAFILIICVILWLWWLI